MPPAVLLPAVLPLPMAGDLRASPPPAVAAGTNASAADPDAAQGFGRALGEAMQDLGKAPAQRGKAREERAPQAADGVPAAPGVAPNPAPAEGPQAVVAAVVAVPAPVAAAMPVRPRESDARAANGAAAPLAAHAPAGKTLPLADEALPRAVPAAPATASGGAQEALARPAAGAAGPLLTPSFAAQPLAPVASTARDASAATEPSLAPAAAAATLSVTGSGATRGLPPGLVEVASRQAAESALQAPAGPAGASAQPLPQAGLARALDRAAAGTEPTRASDARASEASPRRAAAVLADVARVTAPSGHAIELAHDAAAARRSSSGSASAPGVPASAADPGEPATQPLHPTVRDNAGSAPGVAMPLAVSVGVAPPASPSASAATQPLAAGGATRRQHAHAPASPAGPEPAPGAAQAHARAADNAATPWLQALSEARELAADGGSAPPDGDATGASAPFAGERTVTAGPALPALAVAAARAEAGAGPGVFAAPLAVGQAGAEWAGELEARVQWLAGRNLRSAEIQLDPPELGPLQVQVQSHRDGASVHFTTHSAAVRDLVEQSLPRLREMLESSGMNLVDVNVAQQQGGRGQREPLAALPGVAGVHGEVDGTGAATVVVSARGLVDAYA